MKTWNRLLTINLCLTIIILSNCKRIGIDDTANNEITFSAGSIEEKNETDEVSTRSNNKSERIDTSEVFIQKELLDYKGLDIDLIVSEESIKTNPLTKAVTSSNLAPTTKYTVVLFNADNNGNPTTIFAQGETSANSPIPFRAYRNKKYRWYAYSYNNSTDIIDYNNNSPAVIVNSSAISEGSDFLYATGVIQTSNNPSANNKIVITFQRKVSAIRFEVDARGVFSSIKNLEIDFPASTSNNGFINGKFSIPAGIFTETSNATQFSRNTWINQIADTVPTNWVKYNQLLTVPNGQPMNLKAVLKNLILTSQTVNPDKPADETFVDRNFANSTSSVLLDFPAFTPISGKRYIVNVRLKESAINFVGTNWARGNLTYVANAKENKYRFWFHNVYVKNISGGMNNFLTRDYFYNKPAAGEPTVTGNWDPCKLVYPKNTWRLPTTIEISELINYDNYGNINRANQPAGEGWYLIWKDVASIGPPRYIDKHLRFVAAGYLRADGTLAQFNYNSTALSADEGHFRTSTPTEYLRTRHSGSLGNLSLSTQANYDGRGANVRCVKN